MLTAPGPLRLGYRPLCYPIRERIIGSSLLIQYLLASNTFSWRIASLVLHHGLSQMFGFYNAAGHRQTRLLEPDNREDRTNVCARYAAAGHVRLWQWATGLLPADTRTCTCQVGGG